MADKDTETIEHEPEAEPGTQAEPKAKSRSARTARAKNNADDAGEGGPVTGPHIDHNPPPPVGERDCYTT